MLQTEVKWSLNKDFIRDLFTDFSPISMSLNAPHSEKQCFSAELKQNHYHLHQTGNAALYINTQSRCNILLASTKHVPCIAL